jgi:molecular chaperone HscA
VQADLLAGEGRSDDVLLLDVIPLSLGIEVGGGVVDKILPRNSTIPCSAKSTYTTQEDRQTGFEIHVVQGEREMVADNRSLARFTLKGIPPMPAGMARLEVTFHVDADGLLGVHAKEITTGSEQTVSVKPSYGLDDAAVEQMLMDALDHGEEDLERRRLAENRVEAGRILLAARKALVADRDLLGPGEDATIGAACDRLDEAMHGDDPSKIHARIESLDDATKAFAARRMNRAIARAIEGRKIDAVEKTVEHAKGIEEAHAAMGRGGGVM